MKRRIPVLLKIAPDLSMEEKANIARLALDTVKYFVMSYFYFVMSYDNCDQTWITEWSVINSLIQCTCASGP